jgi:SAM-dependent methyltransferase
VKQAWPAAERNKAPILDVLRRVLPASGKLLEIASGTGQHAAYFAEQLPGWVIQPSDIDSENLESIEAWVAEARLQNLRRPFRLDVLAAEWGVGRVEALFCANMIHIAPFACAEALLAGAGRHLNDGGRFVLYGPFRVGGEHTAPSNADFDADLRRRDARFGVRDLETLETRASSAGLTLIERVPMPANNFTLIFERAFRTR